MLYKDKLKIKGSFIKESQLPTLNNLNECFVKDENSLDETDDLHIGYGILKNVFPYKQLNVYSRKLEDIELDVFVLENEYLKATFLPSLGGRLWSLFDKEVKRELLYKNEVFRPCNLSTRNAWFSGGIEWNMGIRGHSPFTCAKVFVASMKTKKYGDVLRIYEYERIRGIVFQIDFFIPENSRQLYCRTRIENPKKEIVPMYWWSNTAIKRTEQTRVISPANYAYSNNEMIVGKMSYPISNGIDISFPQNTKTSLDYFYKLEKGKRYEASVENNGQGLLQCSSSILKGRKLFTWGQCKGGLHWEEFLTNNNDKYVEVQAGLANTQYECLPMPGETAWEFVESYASLKIDGRIKDFYEQRNAIEKIVEETTNLEYMDKLLEDTKADFGLEKGTLLYEGSGFGALENYRRKINNEKCLPTHLSFEEVPIELLCYKDILDIGRIRDKNINYKNIHYMLDDEYFYKLYPESSYEYYLLGCYHYAKEEYEKAIKALKISIRKDDFVLSKVVLAYALFGNNQKENSRDIALEVLGFTDDVIIYRELLLLLTRLERFEDIIKFFINDNRCKLYISNAHLKLGNIHRAEEILYENDGLVIPDIREGESSITTLWFEIQEAKGVLEQEAPYIFNFRQKE